MRCDDSDLQCDWQAVDVYLREEQGRLGHGQGAQSSG